MKLLPILAFLTCLLFSNVASAQYTITINISGFRTNKGTLYLSMYKGKDGYPKEYKKAIRVGFSAIKNNKCTLVFKGLPKGDYAFAFFHDENGNSKVDKNFLGIPKEGIGFSNNARIFLGPPRFKKAKFTVDGDVTQEVKIRY